MIEKKMLKKLKQILPYVMFEGIETSTTLGFPDVLYGYGSIMGVMELKEINRTPVNKFTVPWRPGQLAWHRRFVKKNSSPYMLVLTLKDSWYFIPNIKESYSTMEANVYYVGETSDLVHVRDRILHVLFPTV